MTDGTDELYYEQRLGDDLSDQTERLYEIKADFGIRAYDLYDALARAGVMFLLRALHEDGADEVDMVLGSIHVRPANVPAAAVRPKDAA